MSNIYTDNLVQAFPRALNDDTRLHTLAYVGAKYIQATIRDTDVATIYACIDELPEPVLDILAYDFKVDWWDYNYTVEQKCQTLKDSFYVHRHLGTKAAVETAISAIYPATEVKEWFEYNGLPYYFKLFIDLTDVIANPDAHEQVLRRVFYYKNLRSHLEEIQYTIRAHSDDIMRMGGCMASVVNFPLVEIADTFRFEDTSHIGGRVATQHRMPIPEFGDTLQFSGSIHTGGQTMTYTFMPLPEINS